MNSNLFGDFCRRGTESKLELIDGKLIVGNSIVGSRLLLRQILQGWGAEAAVAIKSPISLWIKALVANLELNPAEINREDLHTTITQPKSDRIKKRISRRRFKRRFWQTQQREYKYIFCCEYAPRLHFFLCYA